MADEQDNDFEMVSVAGSSRVRALGHKGDKLRAEFPNGRIAEYTGVSEEVYQTVLNSPSVGGAFGELIVHGGYPFEYV